MERTERKKVTRRNLSKKIRHDRFISGYVEVKYPQAYREADNHYNQLNTKYPNKRDLCKTIEYIQLTTGIKTYSEYYHHNRPGYKRKNQEVEETNKKQVQDSIVDNMVLEIPLMNTSEKIPSINTSESMANIQLEEANELSLDILQYEEIIQELRNDPDLYNICNDLSTYGDDIVDMSGVEKLEVTVEHTGESFLNIPDKVYEDIIQELTNDPDLSMIFDDIDVDIEYQEQTPLEKELVDLGY